MSVMYALTRLVPFYPSTAALYIGYAFGGGLNLLITWLAIARAWRGLQSPTYSPQHYYAPLQYQSSGAAWQQAQQHTLPVGHGTAIQHPSLAGNRNARFKDRQYPDKSKAAAILLLIFLGMFQAHAFYIGWKKAAIIKLSAFALSIAIFIGGISELYGYSTVSGAMGGVFGALYIFILVWNIVDLIRIAAKPGVHFRQKVYYGQHGAPGYYAPQAPYAPPVAAGASPAPTRGKNSTRQ